MQYTLHASDGVQRGARGKVKKILGYLLTSLAAIRWLPDLLESAQATAKYGKWVYVQASVPRSGLLTITIFLIGVGLIFSEMIQNKVHQWMHKRTQPDLPTQHPRAEMFTDEQKKLMRRSAGITPKPLPEQHPNVLLEWDSGQPWGHDQIRLRNRGTVPALNIRLGNFSWPGIDWHLPIEIQSLDPNAPEVVREAEFYCRLSSGHETGYMNRVLDRLDSAERPPLSISATFSDLQGNIFQRTFILKRGIGRKAGVIVTLGELQII